MDDTTDDCPMCQLLANTDYLLRCTVDNRTGNHTVHTLLAWADFWLYRAGRALLEHYEATGVIQVKIGTDVHHCGITLLAKHRAAIEAAAHVPPAATGRHSDNKQHMRERAAAGTKAVIVYPVLMVCRRNERPDNSAHNRDEEAHWEQNVIKR